MFKRGFTFIGLASLLMALMLAVPGASLAEEDETGPSPSGISGTAQTGVQIQNVGSADATVDVVLYPQAGGNPITLAQRSVAEESAENYFLPSISNVTAGNYSMVVSANQAIQGIVRTDWPSTGGSGIYGTVSPSNDVIVPLVTKNFAGQTSRFTVQAAGGNATYNVNLFGLGSATAVKTLSGESLTDGRSKTYNLATDDIGNNLPNTGADLGVTTGFVGYARITATAGQVVVQSFIDIAGSRGVTAFNGVPANSASTTLFAPLVRANFFGDTGIQLVNPGGTDASVDIQFFADANSPVSSGTTQSGITVPANSSFIAFQGPGGNSRTAGLGAGSGQSTGSPTPTNSGFFGVARITSSQPIIAVVNDAVFGAGFSVTSQSTYNAETQTNAGTRFALPLVRARHVTGALLTTGVQVQNTSGNQATVNISVTGYNGTTQTNVQQLSIPANGSGNYYQGSGDFVNLFPSVPSNLGGSGWFGSAIITSDQPVVILVNDANFPTGISTVFDGANYNGIKIQ